MCVCVFSLCLVVVTTRTVSERDSYAVVIRSLAESLDVCTKKKKGHRAGSFLRSQCLSTMIQSIVFYSLESRISPMNDATKEEKGIFPSSKTDDETFFYS